eukprot:gene17608-19361_t
MTSQYEEDRIVGKVDELAASLHATTDVLSTADRMLGHYRDMNREQDIEIARLNQELATVRHSDAPTGRGRKGRNLPKTPSFSDLDERRKPRSSRVRFTEDEDSASELEEFESAIRDLNRKQDRLQREMRRDRRRRSNELRSLADAPRRDSSDSLVDLKLSEIQQQLQRDKRNKRRRQDTVEQLADEIRQIRSIVQDRDVRDATMPRSDLSTRSRLEDELERERSLRDQETISDLRRQLRQREDDQERLISQVKKSKANTEEVEANLQRSKIKIDDLESRAEKGQQEKRKLENDLETLRDQNTRLTRENTELATQLNVLRDKKIVPDVYASDLQRKIDDLEYRQERSTQKLTQFKNESERKDVLIDRLKSQVSELTERTDKAEFEKRKYITELEEAMKKLRNLVRNEEDLKSLLLERDKDLKDSEEKRQELKSKALEAVKEYRSKCRDLERDKKRLQDRTEVQEDELAKIRFGKHEVFNQSDRTDWEIKEQRNLIEKLQNDLQRQQNQMLQMEYEKAQLQGGFSTSMDSRKDIARLQREIQELNAKILATSSQLADETAKRREAEDRLQEARDQGTAAKEESSNLYQQLQEERASHTRAMKQLEDELQTVSATEERTTKELMDKTNQDKSRYEDEIRLLKVQLAQEKSIANASIASQDERKYEIEKISSALDRKIEENRKIRKRYLVMKSSFEDKIAKLENDSIKDKDRIAELEGELRNNQENLLQTRESFKQSLREICYLTDSLLDGLMQETNESMPTKSISDSAHIDAKKLSLEILEKLRSCANLLSQAKEKTSNMKNKFSKAQEKIEELLGNCDHDKKYFMTELEKQNELIEDLKKEKKHWDKKFLEKKKATQKLQVRVNELTKHLEQVGVCYVIDSLCAEIVLYNCIKILHSSIEAMDDREKVLSELEYLQDEQVEQSRINENYIRHEERVESLHDQLEDAKMALQGLKDENVDATTFSLAFLRSLSPAAKRPLEEKPIGNSRRRLHDDKKYQSTPFRIYSSDIKDSIPSPPKRSKDVLPMTLSDRDFNER